MILGWWLGELLFTVFYLVLLIKPLSEWLGKAFNASLFLMWTLIVMEILRSGKPDWKPVALGAAATLVRGTVLDCARILWKAFDEVL